MVSENKSNLIFYIAVFLLPFENLVFSPSNGWGAVSPLVFGLYVFLAHKKLEIKGEVLVFILILVYLFLISLTNLLFFVPESQLEVAILRTLRTMVPLIAGISTFLSFKLVCKDDGVLAKVEQVLFVSYSIALLIGLIQYITINYGFSLYAVFDSLLTKRSTLSDGRVQFTFTEPSFIGMHVFGVLLPLSFICQSRRLIYLVIGFIVMAFLGHSGVRIWLDTAVVLFVFIWYRYISVKKYYFIVIFLIITSLFVVYEPQKMISNIDSEGNYTDSSLESVRERFLRIIDGGIYADSSLASRYFRVNSLIKGYIEDPCHAIIGYGLGQEVYPLKQGYDQALAEYKNAYVAEVNALRDLDNQVRPNIGYCFYTRLISEGGVLLFIIFLFFIARIYYSKQNIGLRPYIIIMLYLYLQFGSYAFYSLWILLYFGTTSLRLSERNNL